MRRFLKAQNLKKKKIQELLQTTPATAGELAHKHLSEKERMEVARYIFPLVYTGDGLILLCRLQNKWVSLLKTGGCLCH